MTNRCYTRQWLEEEIKRCDIQRQNWSDVMKGCTQANPGTDTLYAPERALGPWVAE